MSHFAEIDKNNIVVRVIVAEKNFINTGFVGDEFNWVQTSYNNNFRKNYAGIGYSYDKSRDAFIPPQPYPSWLLDEDTCLWDSPIPRPDDDKHYKWNETTTSWDEVTD
jgi:hypothetical protein